MMNEDNIMEIDNRELERHKRNSIVYFYGYFAVALILVVINSFLPIYYLNVLEIPKEEVAVVLLFALLIFLSKPIFSVYFDKKPKSTRILAICSAIGLIVSFSLLLFTLASLILFAVFLTTTFGLISLVDSSVDKYLVATSFDDKVKNKYVLWTQLGGMLGSVAASALYLVVGSWEQLFIAVIGLALPLIFITFLLRSMSDKDIAIKQVFIAKKKMSENIDSKSVVLLCVFFFFYGSNYLYDWVLEPWVDATFVGGADLYFFFTIVWILLNAVGYFIGVKVVARFSKLDLISYPMIICGVLFFIAPFVDLFILLVLVSITQVLAGIITIALVSYLIDFSRDKVTIFQFVVSFGIVARVILTPLGLVLYSFMPGGWVVSIGGIGFAISAIPIFLLGKNDEGSD